MRILRLARSAAGALRWSELGLSWAACPLCDGGRPFVRLRRDEIAVRCTGCGASAVSLSIVSVVREIAPDLASRSVYEMSARGPFHAWLCRHAGAVTGSEYFEDVAPGDHRDGVQCQDAQALTHGDGSFDLCTSTEVLEHVPDDARAFRELLRVLRPGGLLVFTVPLRPEHATLERAVLTPQGELLHLTEPEYHGDPLKERGRILAFRTYGGDVVERLLAAGFSRARLVRPSHFIPWGFARPVVVANKA